MPWRETSPMEQRLEFIREFESELFTMTELAAQYGITRKTAYKWLDRYATEGAVGLQDRSRRPHRYPQATAPQLVEAILAVRRKHPRWGAAKLLGVVTRHQPDAEWPCRSTVASWLNARGLVAPRAPRAKTRHAPATALAPITAANDVWTTDFKGEFRTGDGRYCYPLTLRDGFSRFVLRCDAFPARTFAATQARFEQAFRHYGLPARIRSDNGGPFAGPGLGRLSQLNVWWIRLGIVPERIAPGHPEQNGSHEQFHAVLKAETARPPAPNRAAQQQRFRRFCREYNEERPHEALCDRAPASCYVPSARPWPNKLPPLEYAAHLEIRRVSSAGCVSWGGAPLFLNTALAGESVAFEEVDDDIWTLYFAHLPLARYDGRHRTLLALPIAMKTRGGGGKAAAARTKRQKNR